MFGCLSSIFHQTNSRAITKFQAGAVSGEKSYGTLFLFFSVLTEVLLASWFGSGKGNEEIFFSLFVIILYLRFIDRGCSVGTEGSAFIHMVPG